MEIVPKKTKQLKELDTQGKELSVEFETIEPKKNSLTKDIVLGQLLKETRKSNFSMLFGILTNIKSFELKNNVFMAITNNPITYNDIRQEHILKFIINTLQKIDSRLHFEVKLKGGVTEENITSNINLLKEEFGEVIKIIE